MLINLRNALMAGKRLPYDAEVEYLESTGTQWIDVPVNVSAGQYFEVSGEAVFKHNGNTRGMVFASNVARQFEGNFYSYNATDNSIIYGSIIGSIASNGGWVGQAGQANAFKVSTLGVTRNEEFFQNVRPITTGFSTLRLMAGYAGVSEFSNSYSFPVQHIKIVVGNRVVFDAIPVRKGTIGYLYDRVSGKLFGNAGTGNFALGPDVVPVEYIESHGTEWIDTGLRVTPTSKFSIDFVGNYGGNFAVCGASNGSAYNNGEIAIFWNVGKFDIVYPTGRNSSLADSIGSYVQGTRYSITYKSQQAIINGQTFQTPTWSNEYVADRSFFIGATNRGTADKYPGRGFYYGFKMWDDDVLHGSFLPVRVGTDATSWEGAMMDVLTRRIYRNQGTGAFTFGNDLKYPIPAE